MNYYKYFFNGIIKIMIIFIKGGFTPYTMAKLFGTDGIRGKANSYPITPEMALTIGKAAAKVFRNHNKKHKILIGKDTRLSGYIIETALTSGICSMGVDVFLVGPMPTPAVAHLTRSLGVDASIMITASHNPADDNGIKFFNSKGLKLDDEVEKKIEKEVFSSGIASDHITGDLLGKATRIDDASGRYIEHVKMSVGSVDLSGTKVVVDCANGAAYSVAPKILKELGATVIAINANPDGLNINLNCGSTHLDSIKKAVIENKADIGISLDGDADRGLLVDERGEEFDGDFIMALCGKDLKDKGLLKKNTIVATVLSNHGLGLFCKKNNIKLIKADNGDRYVLRELVDNGYNFGGELTGHIIFLDHGATTGDGIMTGVQILKIMKESNKKLSQLRLFEKTPQLLTSTDVQNRKDYSALIKPTIDKIEKEMGDTGRVWVKCSGTQNLCRILVEGQDKKKLKQYVDELTAAIQKVDKK